MLEASFLGLKFWIKQKGQRELGSDSHTLWCLTVDALRSWGRDFPTMVDYILECGFVSLPPGSLATGPWGWREQSQWTVFWTICEYERKWRHISGSASGRQINSTRDESSVIWFWGNGWEYPGRAKIIGWRLRHWEASLAWGYTVGISGAWWLGERKLNL